MLGNGIFHGMYNPATVWSSDSSLYFDGVNDYARLVSGEGSFDEIAHSMTVSMWVRLKPSETYQDSLFFQIYSRDNGRLLFFWDANAERILLQRWDALGANVQTIGAPLTVSTITKLRHTNLLFVIASGSMTIFIDGDAQPGLVATIPTWSTGQSQEMFFGAQYQSSGINKFCSGWIHDISIWNTELPPNPSIAEIYNEGDPNNVLELRANNLWYYHTCSEKNFEQFDTPIPTKNYLSPNNPVLSGAIISRHDEGS